MRFYALYKKGKIEQISIWNNRRYYLFRKKFSWCIWSIIIFSVIAWLQQDLFLAIWSQVSLVEGGPYHVSPGLRVLFLPSIFPRRMQRNKRIYIVSRVVIELCEDANRNIVGTGRGPCLMLCLSIQLSPKCILLAHYPHLLPRLDQKLLRNRQWKSSCSHKGVLLFGGRHPAWWSAARFLQLAKASSPEGRTSVPLVIG